MTNYDVQFAAIAQANAPGGQKIKQGFSAGSGLRSIAEGSSNAANDAVNNQEVAGHQAAYVAKNTLAQSAAAVSPFPINESSLLNRKNTHKIGSKHQKEFNFLCKNSNISEVN